MKFIFIGILLLLSAPAHADLATREVSYTHGEVELTGYLAYDDARQTPAPGILVVHEWWGNNDYARKRAEQLAGLGYVAFAIDMYGTGRKAETPEEARALSNPFYEDRNLMRRRALAGLETLKAQTEVDKDRTAVIGYCFGGTVALEVARAGADIKGAVSLHGGLATPAAAKAGEVKAHVLALNGAADPMVTAEDRKAFAEEMTNAEVNFKSIDYPGATHAFTNPAATETGKKFGIPVAYNEGADKASFAEMQAFLARVFTPAEEGGKTPPLQ